MDKLEYKLSQLAKLYFAFDHCADLRQRHDFNNRIEMLENELDPVPLIALQCILSQAYASHNLPLAEVYLNKAVSNLLEVVDQKLAAEMIIEEASYDLKESRARHQLAQANLTQDSRWN